MTLSYILPVVEGLGKYIHKRTGHGDDRIKPRSLVETGLYCYLQSLVLFHTKRKN